MASDVASCTQLTVLSWNLLSPTLMDRHDNLYQHAKQADLRWTTRAPRIFEQLQAANADLVCLQEVDADVWPDVAAQMRLCGYAGIFKQRTGNEFGTPDGIALFWKSER